MDTPILNDPGLSGGAPSKPAKPAAIKAMPPGAELIPRAPIVLYCFDGHGQTQEDGLPKLIERPAIVMGREVRRTRTLVAKGGLRVVGGKRVRVPDQFDEQEDEYTDLLVFLTEKDRAQGLHPEQSALENTDPDVALEGTWREWVPAE